jgi:hypothetical protein
MFIVVVIKFKAPNREEIPAKCKAKMDKSTAGPLLYGISLNGGYHFVDTNFNKNLYTL